MGKEQNLVSIIVPVYNASAYIKGTISSVLNQSYPEWELLLIDDCSTDNSYEIIKAAAAIDNRIHVFRNSVNSKAHESRNVGLRNSRGKYIAFLDADDLWEKEKLEQQLAFMENNDYAFSYTGFKRFKTEPSDGDKVIHVAPQVSYHQLLMNTIIATSTVMVDVEKTGPFEMENVYYDDFVLWLNLLKRVKRAHGLDKPLMNYRIALNSLSRNKWNSAKKVYFIFTNNLGLGYIQSRVYFSLWVINVLLRYVFRY